MVAYAIYYALPVLCSMYFFCSAALLGLAVPKYIDPAGGQQRRLIQIVRWHLLEPWLTVPWALTMLVVSRYGTMLVFPVNMLPMVVLLAAWRITGKTRGETELIIQLRRYARDRIIIVALTWICGLTFLLPFFLVIAGAFWLGKNIRAVRQALIEIRSEQPPSYLINASGQRPVMRDL